MKINPLEWNEVDETTFKAQGLLLLRSSQPFALSIQTLGVAVAVGAETSHKIPLAEPSEVTIIGGKAKVYRKTPPARVIVSNEETFTNIDRLPHESGTVAEVTKAVRLMRLEERAAVQRIREERELQDMVVESRSEREAAKAAAEAKATAKATAKAAAEGKPEGGAE